MFQESSKPYGNALIFQQQGSGNKQAEDEANRETEAKLGEIKEVGKKSGDKVVEDLLKAVTTVNAQPPDRS